MSERTIPNAGFRHVLAALVGLAVVFASAQLLAAPIPCEDDDNCPGESICVEGQCVIDENSERESQPSESDTADVDRGADAECGRDRRCRIERLAQKNRARRYERAFEDERAVQRVLDRREEKRREELIRKTSPWLAGFMTTPEYGPGLYAGFTPLSRLRVEGAWRWPRENIYEEVNGGTVDGTHNYNMYTLGAAYFFGLSEFAPYVRASLGYAHGNFDQYDYESDAGASSISTQWHVGSVGGGIDVQFDFGFQCFLGLSVSHLIFNQARVDRGDYDDSVRDAIGEDFFPLDLEFGIGWAI